MHKNDPPENSAELSRQNTLDSTMRHSRCGIEERAPIQAHALHAMAFIILLLHCLARRFHQTLWVGLRLTPSRFGPDSRGGARLALHVDTFRSGTILSVRQHPLSRSARHQQRGAQGQPPQPYHEALPLASLESREIWASSSVVLP